MADTTLHLQQSQQARPRAATLQLDPVQLYAQAENSLVLALYYLRRPASNVPGAARKTVQAIGALNRLKALGFGPAANDAGRA